MQRKDIKILTKDTTISKYNISSKDMNCCIDGSRYLATKYIADNKKTPKVEANSEDNKFEVKKGFCIKLFVAPTTCIFFNKNLFE